MPAKSGINVGYNIQIAVDVKPKLIVEQQVRSKVSDVGLLTDTAVAARKIMDVDQISAVADKGYYKIEDISAFAAAGIVPYLPGPKRSPAVGKGFFAKKDFRYDAKSTSISVPAASSCPPPAGAVRSETSSSQIIPIRLPARDVRCACDAPTASSASRLMPEVQVWGRWNKRCSEDLVSNAIEGRNA